MIVTDNAAFRLHCILKEIFNSKDNDKLFDIWSRVLQAQNKDRSIVYKRLSYVTSLPEKISDQINRHNNINKDLYLSWQNNVSKLLNFNNLDTNWSGIKNWIPAESMTALQFCSEKLSESIENKEIDDGEISQLILDAEELLKEIENSGLDSKSKSFVEERLNGVISALKNCSIYGPKAFETEFEHAVGSIALHEELVDNIARSSFREKFWAVMGRFATVISISTAICITAPEQIQKYLGPPSQENEAVIERTIENQDSVKENVQIIENREEDIIIEV